MRLGGLLPHGEGGLAQSRKMFARQVGSRTQIATSDERRTSREMRFRNKNKTHGKQSLVG